MGREQTSAQVVSTSTAGYEAVIAVRGHKVTIDEPLSDGGTDAGPTPTELLLGALASCYTLALRWAAKRHAVPLGDIQVTAVGTYERLRAAGVEFTQEPTERFYGTDCALRDPFGNPVRFTQLPG